MGLSMMVMVVKSFWILDPIIPSYCIIVIIVACVFN